MKKKLYGKDHPLDLTFSPETQDLMNAMAYSIPSANGEESVIAEEEPAKVNVGSIGHLDETDRHPVTNVNEVIQDKLLNKKEVLVPEGTLKLFTLNKTKIQFELNKSSLFPKKTVLLSGKGFSAQYRKQLNKLLYNPEDVNNMNSIIEIAVLWNYVVEQEYPIQLVIEGYKKKSNEVLTVLNDFFNYNKPLIADVFKMISDQFTSNPESL